MSDPLETQREELDAILSMYADDIHDVNREKPPLSYHIYVRSCVDIPPDAERAVIELHVKYPKTYPNVACKTFVKPVSGVSDAEVEQLSLIAKRTAEEGVPDICVYDIMTKCAEYLDAHQKVPQRSDTTSLHDTMLQERKKKEAEQREAAEQQRAMLVQSELKKKTMFEQSMLSTSPVEHEIELSSSDYSNSEVDDDDDDDDDEEEDEDAQNLMVVHLLHKMCNDQQSFSQLYRKLASLGLVTFDPSLDSYEGYARSWSNTFRRNIRESVTSTPLESAFWSTASHAFRMASAANSRYLSDFEEIEYLGKGGFGDVVKVRNKIDSRMYAIKRVKLDPSNRVENRRILREVRLLSRLQHRHVVRYYNAWIEGTGKHADSSSEDEESEAEGSDDEHPFFFEGEEDRDEEDEFEDETELCLYIQMEYCPNRTLRQLIDDGLLAQSPDERWRIFAQLLDGLRYIHSMGIIHRDLKPANVFIDDVGDCKLGDFGLSTTLRTGLLGTESPAQGSREVSVTRSELLRKGSLSADVGTFLYMAPEQEAGGKHYDTKIDMYALGIIFFEMVCKPFGTTMERVDAIRKAREYQLDKVPVLQEEDKGNEMRVLRLLLHKSPKQRPTAAELLQEKWLPREIESEKWTEIMRSLANSDSALYRRIMRVLFSDTHIGSVARDIAFDVHTLSRSSYAVELPSQEGILQMYGRCATTQLALLNVIPKTTIVEHMFDAAEAIDPYGTILLINPDSISACARFLARTQQCCLRRHDAIHVLHGARDRNQVSVCVMDLVGSREQASDLEFASLLTLCSIAAEHSLVVKITHVDIADALHEVELEDADVFDKVKPASLKKHVPRLRSSILEELQQTARMISSCLGERVRVEFDPSLDVDGRRFSGVYAVAGYNHNPAAVGALDGDTFSITELYCAHRQAKDVPLDKEIANKKRRRFVGIAAHARYDRFVDRFGAPPVPLCACNVTTIVMSASASASSSYTSPSVVPTQVFSKNNAMMSTTFGVAGPDLQSRMVAMCALWDRGLHVVSGENPSFATDFGILPQHVYSTQSSLNTFLEDVTRKFSATEQTAFGSSSTVQSITVHEPLSQQDASAVLSVADTKKLIQTVSKQLCDEPVEVVQCPLLTPLIVHQIGFLVRTARGESEEAVVRKAVQQIPEKVREPVRGDKDVDKLKQKKKDKIEEAYAHLAITLYRGIRKRNLKAMWVLCGSGPARVSEYVNLQPCMY